MISEKLINEINEQIKYEFYSENFYLALSAYCASIDLDGFANWFKVQAEEEKFHALKFFDYVVERGGRVEIKAIDAPPKDFSSILEVFQAGYKHEQFVTKRIYGLMDLAQDEKEHATISFLKWYIDEQIEEESSFSKILKQLERISENQHAIYMLDKELSTRTFVPPTN